MVDAIVRNRESTNQTYLTAVAISFMAAGIILLIHNTLLIDVKGAAKAKTKR